MRLFSIFRVLSCTLFQVILGTILEGGEAGITDTFKKKPTRFDDLPEASN